MTKLQNSKQYDLEGRTLEFAKRVRLFVKKDFLMRIKICRKEAKETRYWLSLLDVGDTPALEKERGALSKETTELMMIFGAIMRKSE